MELKRRATTLDRLKFVRKNHFLVKSFQKFRISVELDSKLLTGWSLLMSQIWAMFLKKFIYTKRNYILLIIQNVIPLVFIVMTMLIVNSMSSTTDQDLPELLITLDSYAQTSTVLQVGEFETESLQYKIWNSYAAGFKERPQSQQLLNTVDGIQDFILGQVNDLMFQLN